MTKWIVSVFIILSTAGCASIFNTGGMKGSFAEKKRVNASVEGIIKAFDKVTLGVRGKSANGREIVSRYMSPKADNMEAASTKKSRGYARLLILGDRRPYDLQLQFVLEEDRGGGDYEALDTDDERSHKLLKKVLDALATRPDNKDFIDDFKAF